MPDVRYVLALVAGLLVPVAQAGEANTIGLIKVASGEVSVQRQEQILTASVGMPVQQTDVIVTGADGSAGVSFRDNTLLSLGPNSRLALDVFRFDTTTHQGAFESTLSRGRMAVVSGKIAKQQLDAMKVRTPTALLGVRGTEFLVEAGE